jgi:hypothetical protein
MFDYRVSFELLGVGDGGRVITNDVYRVAHAMEQPKLDDELPYPNSIIRCFSSGHILSLHSRLSHERLLAAPLAQRATIHQKHISRFEILSHLVQCQSLHQCNPLR